MPGTIAEYVKSRMFGDENARLVYKIRGTQDEAEALSLLLGEIPASAVSTKGETLTKREIEIEEEDYGIWTGTCNFVKRPKKDPLDPKLNPSSYQFETGGGNTHITHSISTLQRVRADAGTLVDFHSAIGFDGQQIAGCDIVSPVFNFSETHSFDDIPGAYKLALFRATGKINNATFKGFAAGEVLFLGASGSKRGDDNWEISFRFAASENVNGLSVGGISGINKRGWDYLWLFFEDDGSQDVLVKKPSQAMVEKVYMEHDFANIGIGV
jgi:hypothetical protein